MAEGLFKDAAGAGSSQRQGRYASQEKILTEDRHTRGFISEKGRKSRAKLHAAHVATSGRTREKKRLP